MIHRSLIFFAFIIAMLHSANSALAQSGLPAGLSCPVGFTPVTQAAPTGLEQLEGRPLNRQEADMLRARLAAIGDATVQKCVPLASQMLPSVFGH